MFSLKEKGAAATGAGSGAGKAIAKPSEYQPIGRMGTPEEVAQ